ncbi:MAG TPA: hypothetical protein ACQGQF_02790 [Xylella fastidiosa subsp. pauca]|uniref:hypothetical protein n=1 Tax=Xylella fastidiosa TaxID=2371 RepID=UPI000AEAE81F|nr:hypothetical protein [Xylella fastidiosa]
MSASDGMDGRGLHSCQIFVLIIASDLEGAWLREDILGRVVGVRVSDVVVIEVSFF